jgi:hypothetical protein
MDKIQASRQKIAELENALNAARDEGNRILVDAIDSGEITGYRLAHELGVSQTRAYTMIKAARKQIAKADGTSTEGQS